MTRLARLVAAAALLIGIADAGVLLSRPATPERSDPYGVRVDHRPEYDVLVEAGGALSQELVDRHPKGTRFGIAPGWHRLDEKIRPRAAQQFLGLPGAVVSGSKVLRDFVRDSEGWVAEGQTQRVTEEHGECEADAPACGLAEDVFFDDEPLAQVTSLDALQPGRFYFDYTRNRIHLADDPHGHVVETTVADAAFWGERDQDDPEAASGGTIPDVVVRNLVIEKFGSQAQDGAVDGRASPGWVVEQNTIRLNHGAGLHVADGSRVVGNKIVSNGQLGIAGRGKDLVVERNEIAHNNWAGFLHGWEAGGTKWVATDGLVIRRNWSHHNRGPGLWTDQGNIRTLYEENVVEDNYSAGIFHEISYDAVISGNTVRRNGAGHAEWGYGAGIQVSASSNVTVVDNVVEASARGITLIMQERGSGPHGPREVANVRVIGNTIGPGNGPSGLFSDVGEDAYFTNRGNRFDDNTYLLEGGEDPHFEWMDSQIRADQWQAYGNDVNGTFAR